MKLIKEGVMFSLFHSFFQSNLSKGIAKEFDAIFKILKHYKYSIDII